MQPDVCKSRIGIGAAALGDFVFVMGKHQIVAATMNVKRCAKEFVGHGRRFDMPPRAATAPRAVPT